VNYISYFIYRYSALGPVWAETRAQSVDWYSFGTLHPGQVLRGSLPLLSPIYFLYNSSNVPTTYTHTHTYLFIYLYNNIFTTFFLHVSMYYAPSSRRAMHNSAQNNAFSFQVCYLW